MRENLFSEIAALLAGANKTSASAFPHAGQEFNARYAQWIERQADASDDKPPYAPKIDVIAQKGVPPDALECQSYPGAALLGEGEAGKGEYLMYMFAGDRLAPNALCALVRGIGGLRARADLIYADEDVYEKGERKDPLFKTALNEVDLLSFNCIGRPLLVRRELHEKAGPMNVWSDAEFYAYALRCAALCARPVHVPGVLLSKGGPVNIDAAEGRAAIDAYLKLKSQKGYAVNGECANTFRVRGTTLGKERVCMIIPNKNDLRPLRTLLESLEQNALYPEYRIIIVDHETENLETLRYYELLRSNGAAEIIRGEGDNIAALWNLGARRAKGQFLMFLRARAELLSPGFITSMTEYAQWPGAGAVGCRCLDAQGRPLPEATLCADVLENVPWLKSGVRAVSVLRGECMLLRRDVFFNVGTFDETLDAAGAAAELCVRLQRRGRTNIMLGSVLAKVRAERRTVTEKERLRLYDTLRYLARGDPRCSENWTAVWKTDVSAAKGSR